MGDRGEKGMVGDVGEEGSAGDPVRESCLES